jgi:transcriptional regulator with XRE-family HTH domain
MTKDQPHVPQSLGERIAHGRRLLGVREGKDVTVPELAARVGVTPASVYNWEGGTPPGRRNLAKLAAVLGVSTLYLEYGVRQPGPDNPTPEQWAAFFNAEMEAARKEDEEDARTEAAPKRKAGGAKGRR